MKMSLEQICLEDSNLCLMNVQEDGVRPDTKIY